MNAYKNKLNTYSCAQASNDEMQALDHWYAQVLEGADLRDRVAVTGFNISRGAFGLIEIDLKNDSLGTALAED